MHGSYECDLLKMKNHKKRSKTEQVSVSYPVVMAYSSAVHDDICEFEAESGDPLIHDDPLLLVDSVNQT